MLVVACVKQVPDTKKITGDVMNDDGTVKRSALPAIFNPEDLNALEMALQVKERYGGHITVITMGLPAAGAVLRDSFYRGADDVILGQQPGFLDKAVLLDLRDEPGSDRQDSESAAGRPV